MVFSKCMKIEESIFAKEILQKHVFTFGEFYFFENIIVSEIKEDTLFNWSKAKLVLNKAAEFYPSLENKHYISNRLYDYSVDPQGWIKFTRNKYKLESLSVITYNDSGLANMLFERLFYPSSIHRFDSLVEAFTTIRKKVQV